MWNPWKTHWALALVKGIREPHEVKKEILLTSVGMGPKHDLWIRSTVTLPTELVTRATPSIIAFIVKKEEIAIASEIAHTGS